MGSKTHWPVYVNSLAAACWVSSPSRRSTIRMARGEAQTIVENCGNTVILRCSGSEGGGTSRFASRLIGEREIVRVHQSRSRSPREWRSSVTSSEHHARKPRSYTARSSSCPTCRGI